MHIPILCFPTHTCLLHLATHTHTSVFLHLAYTHATPRSFLCSLACLSPSPTLPLCHYLPPHTLAYLFQSLPFHAWLPLPVSYFYQHPYTCPIKDHLTCLSIPAFSVTVLYGVDIKSLRFARTSIHISPSKFKTLSSG